MYQVEIHLSPGATTEHLQVLLDAAAETVPGSLQSARVTAQDFQPIKPGAWVFTCDLEAWARKGTPLFIGLLRLEREPANEVWFALGPMSAHAGYRLSIHAGNQWVAVYQVG